MDDTLTSKLLKVLGVKLFNRLMNFVAKSIDFDKCCRDQMKEVISRFESESYLLTNKSDNNHARSKSMQANIESSILKKLHALQIDEGSEEGDLTFDDCIELINVARILNIRKIFEFVVTCLCTDHEEIINNEEQIVKVLKRSLPPVSVYIILKIFADYYRISSRFEHGFSFGKCPKRFQSDSTCCWNMILYKEKTIDGKELWQKCGMLALHCDKCEFMICRSCGSVSRLNSTTGNECCFICRQSLAKCKCASDECNICSICAKSKQKCNCHFVEIDDETWNDFLNDEAH